RGVADRDLAALLEVEALLGVERALLHPHLGSRRRAADQERSANQLKRAANHPFSRHYPSALSARSPGARLLSGYLHVRALSCHQENCERRHQEKDPSKPTQISSQAPLRRSRASPFGRNCPSRSIARVVDIRGVVAPIRKCTGPTFKCTR